MSQLFLAKGHACSLSHPVLREVFGAYLTDKYLINKGLTEMIIYLYLAQKYKLYKGLHTVKNTFVIKIWKSSKGYFSSH